MLANFYPQVNQMEKAVRLVAKWPIPQSCGHYTKKFGLTSSKIPMTNESPHHRSLRSRVPQKMFSAFLILCATDFSSKRKRKLFCVALL
ncbi:MAG: hypothetical protein UX72_C0039G0013 [Parcubacteria group bacterium GW2011_GWA2_47_10]|nr:MAG: hypothetical protein UX72_C0039G0013 [Parcubacteria group bacterium GW2011_GWA2_47_10]